MYINSQDFLDLNQASVAGFGSISTLRRRIKSGVLPATKLKNKYFVLLSDLEALRIPYVGETDTSVRIWAQRIASQSPQLSPETAIAVASILRGGQTA